MTLKRTDSGEIYFGEAKWTPWDTIDCLVQLEETGEVVNFHAMPDDDMDYGRELFEMLSTKYADQITACTQEEKDAVLVNEIRAQRDTLLKDSDWVANGDVMMPNQVEWLQYRQDLRDITQQAGYPAEVNWPVKPEKTRSTPIDERVTRIIDSATNGGIN